MQMQIEPPESEAESRKGTPELDMLEALMDAAELAHGPSKKPKTDTDPIEKQRARLKKRLLSVCTCL